MKQSGACRSVPRCFSEAEGRSWGSSCERAHSQAAEGFDGRRQRGAGLAVDRVTLQLAKDCPPKASIRRPLPPFLEAVPVFSQTRWADLPWVQNRDQRVTSAPTKTRKTNNVSYGSKTRGLLLPAEISAPSLAARRPAGEPWKPGLHSLALEVRQGWSDCESILSPGKRTSSLRRNPPRNWSPVTS